ncbi:hypothetical protein HYY70_04725 [Candidatus Woesearchaeota archaeon]|nr:hypothetical protein [Candidatus Woesearchaeota archaeon]
MLKKVLNAIKSVLEPISKVIANVINFILLAIVYFIGVGMVSLAMKLFGKHFLELKKQNKAMENKGVSHESNWQEHTVTKQPLEQYYRTF